MKVIQHYAKNQIVFIDNDNNEYFQSYDTIIAVKYTDGRLVLDIDKWNYSKTTAKYRNLFTGYDTKKTKRLIDTGMIILSDLNQ